MIKGIMKKRSSRIKFYLVLILLFAIFVGGSWAGTYAQLDRGEISLLEFIPKLIPNLVLFLS